MAFESGYKQILAAKLNPGDTSMIVNVAPTITAGRIYLKSGSQEEWISYTGVSGTTLTGLSRQLSKTANPATSQGSGYTWIAGTPVRIVAMHDQVADATEIFNGNHTYCGNNCYNGAQTINGSETIDGCFIVSNSGSFTINGVSTPYPVVADTTERDSLYTCPSGGEEVYVQSLNALQVYNGGNSQWESLGIGTPTPQATTSGYGTTILATCSDAEASCGCGVVQANQGPVMYGNMVFKTVSGDFTIDGNELCYGITPSNDFTISAGANLRPGVEYCVRVYMQGTVYNLTLGSGVSNPFGDNLIFKANKDTTLVFFATSSSTLELWTIRTAL